MEHCLFNKLHAKLEIMGIKTYELYQEEAIGRIQVTVWVCFNEHDRTCTESGKHPVMWCGSKVREMVRADDKLTFMGVFEELGISCGLCHAILTKDLRTQQRSKSTACL